MTIFSFGNLFLSRKFLRKFYSKFWNTINTRKNGMPVPHLHGCKTTGNIQFTFPMNRYNRAIFWNVNFTDSLANHPRVRRLGNHITGVIDALFKSQIRIEGFRVVARRHNNFHEKARIVKGRLGDSHLNFKKELFKLEAQVGKS